MSAAKSDQASPKRRRKGVPWRRDLAVLARMQEVERRHWDGEPNVKIAADFGVDEKTIRNDLRRLDELYLERIGDQAETLRGRVVRRLDDIIQRALGRDELNVARLAVMDEAKLMGLVVDKVAPTNPTGERPYANVSDADLLDKAARLLESARARAVGGDGSAVEPQGEGESAAT